jgi:hypothetical protein
MTDEDIFLWARITVLQALQQRLLVDNFRKAPDRNVAFDAARKEISGAAMAVRLPGEFPAELLDELESEIQRATNEMLDDIAAQLS